MSNLLHDLSEQQKIVAYLYCKEALTAKQIAERLCVEPSTVKTHLDRIRDKTTLRNKAAMCMYFFENKLFDDFKP